MSCCLHHIEEIGKQRNLVCKASLVSRILQTGGGGGSKAVT